MSSVCSSSVWDAARFRLQEQRQRASELGVSAAGEGGGTGLTARRGQRLRAHLADYRRGYGALVDALREGMRPADRLVRNM